MSETKEEFLQAKADEVLKQNLQDLPDDQFWYLYNEYVRPDRRVAEEMLLEDHRGEVEEYFA